VSKKVYWLGTLHDECQMCHRPFGEAMYDCAIPPLSFAWGNICRVCFTGYGCRLGTGFGQEYKIQKDGRWLKTRGGGEIDE
jgi:hypothetical protein